MRTLTEHRIEDRNFDETIRGLVRNSPWWLTSALLHGLVLLALGLVPVSVRKHEAVATISADVSEEIKKAEEPEIPDIKPDVPETVQPVLIDRIDPEHPPEVDVESESHDTFGEEGESEAPFSGPSSNSAIGLGPRGGGGRGGGGGRKTGGAIGGSGLTQIAVDLGLQWLADHQDVDADGRWDCDDFSKHDPADDRCDGPGAPLYDVGVTALSLLAFLGAGYTDRASAGNRFRSNVRNGLSFLLRVQDDEGCFGSRSSKHFMYNHAIAALALCEAYWMTHNPRYKKPAQDGLDFIARARNPYLAWRYEPRGGENDTSVTGWMVMALKSGKFAGLDIDPDAFRGARQWIEKMTDPEFGQVGYDTAGGGSARPEGLQDRWPPEKSHAMTAVGMLTRVFLGEDPRRSESLRRGADLCAAMPPRWDPDDGSIDMYYWYYGTLALFQVGGENWKKWNRHMKEAIVKHQHGRNRGARKGSWDPLGPWGGDGGRVYATACMVMCLEVYYRYDRVFTGLTRARSGSKR